MIFQRLLLIAFVAGVTATTVLADGDPANGQMQFERRCNSCHSPLPGETRLGPSLFGVTGRQSGTISNFQYSAAFVEAGTRGLLWLPDRLDPFLANPPVFLSNFLQKPNVTTRMTLKTPDPQTRADIIAYLATLTTIPNLIVSPRRK